MAKVLVDSNVLLDVLIPDPKWEAWSAEALADTANRAPLAINPIVYAEVSVGFERIESLDAALPDELEREALPWDAAFLAGKAFLAYRRRRGRTAAPLPDFYIGAHAAIRGYGLLTRDRGRYETYFPSIELIAP